LYLNRFILSNPARQLLKRAGGAGSGDVQVTVLTPGLLRAALAATVVNFILTAIFFFAALEAQSVPERCVIFIVGFFLVLSHGNALLFWINTMRFSDSGE
jgi:hypothetical protein